MPVKSKVGERNAAVEVSRQRNNHKEAGQLKVSREDVNKSKDGMEPKQLGGKKGVRAAAVNACNSGGVVIDEPIQSWIKGGGIESGRGA